MPITLSQACTGFIHHQTAAGMSPYTLRNYRVSFAKLTAYLACACRPLREARRQCSASPPRSHHCMLAGRLPEVTGWAVEALRHGAQRLLLLGYKGYLPAFAPATAELAAALALLTGLGRATGAVIAADD